MAGIPKRRALLSELRRRAVEELGEGATALDYGEWWVKQGRTLTRLASEISKEDLAGIGEVTRESVRYCVYADESKDGEAEERLRLARAQGAHAIVERNQEIAEDAPATRDEFVKAKLRTDINDRIARVWNRDEMAENARASVTVNIGTLHLDSLRRVASERGSHNLLTSPRLTGEVVDVEVVSEPEPNATGAESTSLEPGRP
jgi:hypothetical protein